MRTRDVGYRGIDNSVLADVRSGMYYVNGDWPSEADVRAHIEYLLAGSMFDDEIDYRLQTFVFDAHRCRYLDIQPMLLPDLVSHAMVSLPTEETSHVDERTDHQAARVE